jgi:Domain of unknown function (DUF5916)/Carbohydrate family 9 binding domain-like
MIVTSRICPIIAVVVCLASPGARAQQADRATDRTAVILGPDEPLVPAKAGKILRAFRVTAGTTPKIDGTLDDEVWGRAESAGDFVQWDPDNGEPASERTLIQVAYDDQFLYVAIRCFDRTPDQISHGLARRDDSPATDTVSVKFDPRHDHQTGYLFTTNPSGLQADSYYYDDDRVDLSFDAVWEVQTTTNDEGWVAEFRVPFSQLRFKASPGPGQVWGLTSRRVIRRRNETSEWIGRPRGERGEVSRWGHLLFDDALTPPRRIEVLPYALARAERQPSVAGTGFASSAGADLRLGIGTSATLSATVNPDFGQVEQDPAVLNLSIFETFFPEKRPFFLEDSRTFVPPYTSFQLFHSRRIGRTPGRFGVPAGETVESRPAETTVLGATKLTGKGAGWTYGAMSALTSREYAHLVSGGEALIEPLTSYNTVRLQRDVNKGTSNIGAIFTGVFREQDTDAFTGGVDYNLRWDRNRVAWNGTWAATRAAASNNVATTSGGGLTNFTFSRKHYGYSAHYDHFGRDFRVNDIGFFRTRANRNEVNGGATLEQPDRWHGFRRMQIGIYSAYDWNDDRLRLYRLLDAYGSLTFSNFWTFNSESGHEFQAFDDLDTRGGPPILVPARQFLYVSGGSDSRKSWRINLNFTKRWDQVGGWSNQIGPSVSLQPSARLQASISTTYTAGLDIAQWITNADVDADGVIDHVYGMLRRNVVDVTLRGTFALNRDTTLQVFLQPFVASGDYSNIRRLARPMSFDFDPATLPSNPDFNNKSMRSNVVLRWEYVRGSTLYAVWNLSRSDESRPGSFSPLRDIGDSFSGAGPNVLMVKISYWMSR